MRRINWIGVALAGVAVVHPMTLIGQGRTVTRADLIGTWRYKEVGGILWDSARKVVSTRLHELVMTFRPDGTFDLGSTMDRYPMFLLNIGPGKGQWTLVGDTLVLEQPKDTLVMLGIRNKYKPGQFVMGGEPPDAFGDTVWEKRAPAKTKLRFGLSSPAPGKLLTMEWVDFKPWPESGMFPLEWWRVDLSKPLLPLIPQPPSVKPADLAGTWVAKTRKATDTLILRADGTWVGEEGAIGKLEDGDECTVPSTASNTGKWYLGPSDVVVFIDALGRRVCTTATNWRGHAFKFDGRRIMSYVPWLFYDRIRSSKP